MREASNKGKKRKTATQKKQTKDGRKQTPGGESKHPTQKHDEGGPKKETMCKRQKKLGDERRGSKGKAREKKN